MSEVTRIDPKQAQALLDANPGARLIDVRSAMEYNFVGHPIGAIHVPLKEFPDWSNLPVFVAQVRALEPDPDTPLILMCRSGVRSMEAAKLLQQAGYQCLYNMEQGFEGDKDADKHRGTRGGWRFHGLPWEQS